MRFDALKYNSNYILTSVAIIYAFIVGAGYYGFGPDYYASYHYKNISWGTWKDLLGWKIATLSISDFHLGVYVTSFILAISSGFLIKDHLMAKRIFSKPLFFLIFVTAIHTWPVIMSTSNVMRQGLAMSVLFISLVFFARRNLGHLILSLILASFMHKSMLIITPIILTSYFFGNFSRNIWFHLLMGFIFFALALAILPKLLVIENHSRIIGGDFRLPFLIISLGFIILGTLKSRTLFKSYNIFIFYFSFISTVFYFIGLNWQYERIGMIMLIPYILSFGSFLRINSDGIYLFSTFISLLALTFSAGMYASLK